MKQTSVQQIIKGYLPTTHLTLTVAEWNQLEMDIRNLIRQQTQLQQPKWTGYGRTRQSMAEAVNVLGRL